MRRLVPLFCLSLVAGCAEAPAPRTAAPPSDIAPPSLVGSSIAGQYLAARHAHALSDTGAAADYYSKALERDPENVELLQRAFVLMAAEGRMDRATDLATRLLTYDGEAATAAFVLAVKAMKNGDPKAAERQLTPLPRRGVSSFMVPLLLGWTLAAQGKTSEALAALKPMRESNAFAVLHDFHAGLISDLAGRMDEAGRFYEGVRNNPSGLSLRAVRVLGSYYVRRGQADQASQLYRRYRDEHPDSPLLDAILAEARVAGGQRPINNPIEGMAEAFFGAAGSLRQAKSNDIALLLARLGLELQPDFALVKVLIGGVLEDMNRYDDANHVYVDIPKSDPLNWSMRIRMAENLNRLKRIDEAAALLEQLASEEPSRFDPLVSLGDVLRSDKRFAEAASAYERAIARIPKIESHHWGLYYARAIAYERTKQWPKAEADFLKALELEPEQPFVLNYLGYSWIEMGLHLERARAMIETAVRSRPTDGYIIDSLGWVLYRLGDYPGAVKNLERAVELRPDDPVINDHLGDAYWKVGRRLEARFQWERALVLKPEPDQVDGIRAKITSGLADTKKQ
ncbi:MAG: tetratricopeptide repeat protein [Rhodospirillales bacterium]|nr:tetratricopeptide repeat protein [Rhodospirillales bacterium]